MMMTRDKQSIICLSSASRQVDQHRYMHRKAARLPCHHCNQHALSLHPCIIYTYTLVRSRASPSHPQPRMLCARNRASCKARAPRNNYPAKAGLKRQRLSRGRSLPAATSATHTNIHARDLGCRRRRHHGHRCLDGRAHPFGLRCEGAQALVLLHERLIFLLQTAQRHQHVE